jgi:hypothetical protein
MSTYLYHDVAEDGHDWGERYDLDLGDGHYFCFTGQSLYEARTDGAMVAVQAEDGSGAKLDDRGPIGGIMIHEKADTPHGYCSGGITFDVPYLHPGHKVRGGKPAPLWQVNSMEPLDLSPSLLCACGDHGFVRAGRWVRA